MKKLLLTILGPFFLVIGVTVGIIWWDRGAPPGFRPPVRDVTVAELTREHRGVRIKGTAHYELRISQRVGDETWYIYPLMPPQQTSAREINALVRTRKEPGRRLGFEDVTVEGLARPPGRLITRSITDELLARGYHFTDDYVLVQEFDEPEPEPEPEGS